MLFFLHAQSAIFKLNVFNIYAVKNNTSIVSTVSPSVIHVFQDMALDRFLKIAQKCKREFVILQVTVVPQKFSLLVLVFVSSSYYKKRYSEIFPSGFVVNFVQTLDTLVSCINLITFSVSCFRIKSIYFRIDELSYAFRKEKMNHIYLNFSQALRKLSKILNLIRFIHFMNLYAAKLPQPLNLCSMCVIL